MCANPKNDYSTKRIINIRLLLLVCVCLIAIGVADAAQPNDKEIVRGLMQETMMDLVLCGSDFLLYTTNSEQYEKMQDNGVDPNQIRQLIPGWKAPTKPGDPPQCRVTLLGAKLDRYKNEVNEIAAPKIAGDAKNMLAAWMTAVQDIGTGEAGAAKTKYEQARNVLSLDES